MKRLLEQYLFLFKEESILSVMDTYPNISTYDKDELEAIFDWLILLREVLDSDPLIHNSLGGMVMRFGGYRSGACVMGLDEYGFRICYNDDDHISRVMSTTCPLDIRKYYTSKYIRNVLVLTEE